MSLPCRALILVSIFSWFSWSLSANEIDDICQKIKSELDPAPAVLEGYLSSYLEVPDHGINDRSDLGHTLFSYALHRDNFPLCQWLLEQGANPYAIGPAKLATLLAIRADAGHPLHQAIERLTSTELLGQPLEKPNFMFWILESRYVVLDQVCHLIAGRIDEKCPGFANLTPRELAEHTRDQKTLDICLLQGH